MPRGMQGFQKGNTLGEKANHKGQKAWNKGLTKETDERVKKYGLSGSISMKGQHNSPETEYKKGNISFSKLHPECMQRGDKCWNWKGGRIKSKGYILILMPNHPYCNSQNYMREHRVIVEEQLGRFLNPEESIHHINKIKTDNRPENLMAFKTESAHKRFESGKIYLHKEIIYDGRIHGNT